MKEIGMKEKILAFWEQNSANLWMFAKNIGAVVIVVVIGVFLSRILQKLIIKSSQGKPQKSEIVYTILGKVVRYGIMIICTIMILNIMGVNTSSLLAILGAAGVAVGLALKDTLGNIAAGIVIFFLGNYRKGEFIEFDSYMGTVKEISLFNTILETPDGIYIAAPNSSIWGSPLKNYTRNGRRRMELSIGIAYSDSVETAFQAMQDIIASEPRFLADPASQVILQSVESHSIKITIRAWTSVDDYWDIYWKLNKEIKAKMEASGLHVPLPQREVRMV